MPHWLKYMAVGAILFLGIASVTTHFLTGLVFPFNVQCLLALGGAIMGLWIWQVK
jgi:hypothetical protein